MEIRLGPASILSWLMIINQLTRFMNLNLNLVEVLDFSTNIQNSQMKFIF